jgi:hypothetical protein
MIPKSIIAGLSCVFIKFLIGIRMTSNLKKPNTSPYTPCCCCQDWYIAHTSCLVIVDVTRFELEESRCNWQVLYNYICVQDDYNVDWLLLFSIFPELESLKCSVRRAGDLLVG